MKTIAVTTDILSMKASIIRSWNYFIHRENLVLLDVFYKELNYQLTKQTKASTTTSLIGKYFKCVILFVNDIALPVRTWARKKISLQILKTIILLFLHWCNPAFIFDHYIIQHIYIHFWILSVSVPYQQATHSEERLEEIMYNKS